MQKAKIAFYTSLETMTLAGLPVTRILQMAVPRKLRGPCRRMAVNMTERGMSFSQSMALEKCFSKLEIALIRVGETTGTLDRSARALRENLEQKKQLKGKLLTGSIQTLLTYASAGPLLKVVDLATCSIGSGCGPNFASWPMAIAFTCLLWWGIPLLLYLLGKMLLPSILSTSFVGALIDALPIFGKLQHGLNCSSFWGIFSTCVNAGLPYSAAINYAAETCPSGFYAKRYLKMAQSIEYAGASLTEAFSKICSRRDESLQFPSIIATGEFSGHLSEAAQQVSAMASAEVQALLHRLSVIVPIIVYLCLALYLAYRIISFYAGYISQLANF